MADLEKMARDLQAMSLDAKLTAAAIMVQQGHLEQAEIIVQLAADELALNRLRKKGFFSA